jgi:hypothetical protein
MDIASLSVSLSQDRLAEQVGTKVLSMALKAAEGKGNSLQNLLASAETVSDPALGTRLDLRA